MDAANALLELRAKINESKKLLEKQEAALLVMEEMMGITPAKAAPTTKSLDFFKGGIAIDDLNVPEKANKKTIKQQVTDVVNLFGDQEFTVSHVNAALLNMGIKIKGNQPKARIAIILNKLRTEGLVVRTVEGRGSEPNKYQLTSTYL